MKIPQSVTTMLKHAKQFGPQADETLVAWAKRRKDRDFRRGGLPLVLLASGTGHMDAWVKHVGANVPDTAITHFRNAQTSLAEMPDRLIDINSFYKTIHQENTSVKGYPRIERILNNALNKTIGDATIETEKGLELTAKALPEMITTGTRDLLDSDSSFLSTVANGVKTFPKDVAKKGQQFMNLRSQAPFFNKRVNK